MRDSIILVQEEPRGPSQLIEVPVPLGLQRVPFPDVTQLRSTRDQRIIIKAIRLITNDVLTAAPILGGLNATAAELRKMSLVIYSEGWEKGQLIPIFVLSDTFLPASLNTSRYNSTRFNNWENINWSKSYIQFSNGTVSAGGAAYVVLLDVEYVKLDAVNTEITGPS